MSKSKSLFTVCKSIFEIFDKHAIIYMFCVALVLSLNSPAGHSDVVFVGGGVMLSLAYYTLKGVLITTRTALFWNKEHPGEPIFKAGGLTEYDRTFAETVGKATGEARRGARSGNLTSYDRTMAEKIGHHSSRN